MLGKLRNIKGEERRYYAVVAAFTAVTLAVTAVVVFLMTRGDEEVTAAPAEIPVARTQSEAEAAEQTARDFLTAAGKFGVLTYKITAENKRAAGRLMDAGSNAMSDFVLTRGEVYKTVRDTYIYRDSPLIYRESAVNRWDATAEYINFDSRELHVTSARAASKGTTLNIGGEEKTGLVVNAEVTSKLTTITNDANDPSSKGVFYVSEGSSCTTVKLVLVKDDTGAWKVYSLETKAPWVLVTWGNPAEKIDEKWLQGQPEVRKTGELK